MVGAVELAKLNAGEALFSEAISGFEGSFRLKDHRDGNAGGGRDRLFSGRLSEWSFLTAGKDDTVLGGEARDGFFGPA